MMQRSTLTSLACLALLAGACSGDDTGGGDASASSTTAQTTSTSSTSATSESTSTSTTTGDATTTTTSTTSTTTASSESDTDTDTDSTTGEAAAEAFRFTKINVRDPHFYIVPIIGCEDITDKDLLAIQAVNKQFNAAVQGDLSDPPDGLLDMNFVLLFRPTLDQNGAGGAMEFITGECTAPIETTSCDILDGTSPSPTSYSNMADGTCFTPNPGELTAMYAPKPGPTTGPCFAGDPLSFTLNLGTFQLPFEDATIAAQYMGDPADGMVQGNIHGFVSEEVANTTLLPMDIPVLGGKPISELLPGGTKNCAKHDDRDMNDGTSGWWFFIEFEAARVPYTGP